MFSSSGYLNLAIQGMFQLDFRSLVIIRVSKRVGGINSHMRFCWGTDRRNWETRYGFSLFYPELIIHNILIIYKMDGVIIM